MKADPERLNSIKAAWMQRYDKTEADWDNFHPVTAPTEEYIVRENLVQSSGLQLDDPSSVHFEYPLCPTFDEMGRRHKKTRDHHLAMAQKNSDNGDMVMTMSHMDEVRIQHNLAVNAFTNSDEIIRKGR